MSWLIAGTVPREDFALTWSGYKLSGAQLVLDGARLPVTRGTPALLAVAAVCAEVLGVPRPEALLAGDIGTGEGSRGLYELLAREVRQVKAQGLTFHYLMPDIYWHNQVLWGLEALEPRPILVADAGFMYAAKMSGFASHYDLFTPDVGEMAFLADEAAPHPFYTRGFLLQEEQRVPELLQRAHAGENAARYLLVKGRTDYVAHLGDILETVANPHVPAMEPIGGTGDSLTGLVTALLDYGTPMRRACHLAALANRHLGLLANPTPAFQIADLLPFLPKALEQALSQVEP